jgi:hypothetical protein
VKDNAVRFRFSLKWLLLVMVYAAIAAAAFSHGHWAYADILWTVSIVAFGYALLLVCVERGPRQALALGFAIFFGCYLVCLYLAPDSLPTSRLLVAMGAAGDESLANQLPMPAAAPNAQLRLFNVAPQPPATYQLQTSGTLTVNTGAAVLSAAPTNPAAVGKSYIAGLSFPLKLRSANAVGSMIAGLLGCLLAAVACRRRYRAGSEVSP